LTAPDTFKPEHSKSFNPWDQHRELFMESKAKILAALQQGKCQRKDFYQDICPGMLHCCHWLRITLKMFLV